MRQVITLLFFSFMIVGCGDDDGSTDAGSDSSTDTSMPDTGTDAGEDAGDDDAGDDAGADAGDPDTGVPPRTARLVVSDADGVSVFYTEDIDRDEDAAADVELATPAVAGLAEIDDRLFVAHTAADDDISVYDDAYDLMAGATAVGTIPSAGTSTFNPIDTLTADGAGAIYFFQPSGAYDRYADATAETLPDAVTATFTHPFGQVHTLAVDTLNDRAFAGQISGAGVQAFNAASTLTGANEPDFQVSADCSSWAMTVSGTRLFAGCVPLGGAAGTIQIWDDIASLTDTSAPDVTLEMDVTGTASSIWDVTIGNDSIFVASQAGLRVWNDASTIDTPRAPDQTVDTGAIRRVVLDAEGTAYVLGRAPSQNVIIVRDAATAPDVWTTLTTLNAATDILVIE